ncbi:MAG: oligosaccharide flippase family protein [Chloroflexota bacterium]
MTSVAALQLLWRLATGGLALLTALLVSVNLGLPTQGVVATSMSVVIGLSVLTGSGFMHAAAFLSARRPDEAGTLGRQTALVTLGTGTVVGVLAALIGPRVAPTLPVLWWHIALALPFIQLAQLCLGLQQGLGRSRAYVAIYVTQPVAAFVLAVIGSLLAAASEQPSDWAGPIITAPFILQGLLSAFGLLRLPRRAEDDEVRTVLSYTARIYPSAVAHYLSYRLDLILVSALLGSRAAGLYSLALNGVDAVARVGQTAATVLFRRFSEADLRRGVALARRSAIYAGALSLIAGVLLAALISLLGDLGSDIQVLGRLMFILSVGGGAISAWTVLAAYLAANDRLAAAARVNIVLLALSLSCYVLLIPIIGVYGGAIGTSVGLAAAGWLGYREVGRVRSEPGGDSLAALLRNPFGK